MEKKEKENLPFLAKLFLGVNTIAKTAFLRTVVMFFLIYTFSKIFFGGFDNFIEIEKYILMSDMTDELKFTVTELSAIMVLNAGVVYVLASLFIDIYIVIKRNYK